MPEQAELELLIKLKEEQALKQLETRALETAKRIESQLSKSAAMSKLKIEVNSDSVKLAIASLRNLNKELKEAHKYSKIPVSTPPSSRLPRSSSGSGSGSSSSGSGGGGGAPSPQQFKSATQEILRMEAAIAKANGQMAKMGGDREMQLLAARSQEVIRHLQTIAKIEASPFSPADIARAKAMAEALNKINLERINKQFEEVKKQAKSVGGGFGELGGMVKGFLSNLAAQAAFELFYRGMFAIQQSIQQTIAITAEYQMLNERFKSSFGGVRQGAEAFEFVRKEAERTGVALSSTAEQYVNFYDQMKNNPVMRSSANELFSGISSAIAAKGLGNEQSQRVFTAFSQIAAKGKVSMEELSRQIAEAGLGEIFDIAAKSMNKTTKEFIQLVSTGKVFSEDLLPKLGKGLKEAFDSKIVDTPAKAFQRFFDRVSLGVAEFGMALTPVVMGGLDLLNDSLTEAGTKIKNFNDLEDAAKRLGDSLKDNPQLAKAFGDAIAAIADTGLGLLTDGLEYINDLITKQPDQINRMIDSFKEVAMAVGGIVKFFGNLIDLSLKFERTIAGLANNPGFQLLEKITLPLTAQYRVIGAARSALANSVSGGAGSTVQGGSGRGFAGIGASTAFEQYDPKVRAEKEAQAQKELNEKIEYARKKQEEEAKRVAEAIAKTSERIADYYRQTVQTAEKVKLDNQLRDIQTKTMRLQYELKSRLSKFGDSILGDFMDSLFDLIDAVSKPFELAVQKNQEILGQTQALADRTQNATEMSRDLTKQGGSAAASGSTRFAGIQVTSAVDASGEPGLDYVVEGGKRGANFGALAAGEVVEVVNNQNWETNLESNPGGQRGYGNQVIIRTIDQVTGEFVDMLYAHLDNVAVQVGQQVGVGTILGTQGRTGSTTGAHVSVDYFGKDSNQTTSAALAMRDRHARELSSGAAGLNQQVSQQATVVQSRPAVSSGGGGQALTQNDVQAITLATLSILEAPTRRGRVDVAAAIANRVGSGAYGSTVQDVAFAPGQFEPFFHRDRSQLRTREDAVRILQEDRGMSREAAEQALSQFFSDLADPSILQDSIRHVGGRTDFKGTTMYGYRVAAEDPLRSQGENFFHISGGQTYDQLQTYQSRGAQVLQSFGGSGGAAIASSTGAPNTAAAQSRLSQGVAIDTQTTSAAIASIRQQYDARGLAAQVEEERARARANYEITEAQRKLDEENRNRNRELEDLMAQSPDSTPLRETQARQRELDRQQEDREMRNRQVRERLQRDATNAEALIKVGETAGDEYPDIARLLPQLRETLEKIKRNLAQVDDDTNKTREQTLRLKNEEYERFQRSEGQRLFETRSQTAGMQSQLGDLTMQLMQRRNPAEAIAMQRQSTIDRATLEAEARKRDIEERLRVERANPIPNLAIVQALEEQLALVGQILETTTAIADEDARRAEVQRQINEQSAIDSSTGDLLGAQAAGARARGRGATAEDLEFQQAKLQLESNYMQELNRIDNSGFSADTIATLKSNLEALNATQMDNLSFQFSEIGKMMPTLQQGFSQLFTTAFTNFDQLGQVALSVLDSIIGKLLEMAAMKIFEDLFGGLFGGGGGAAAATGSGGGGGFLGDAIGTLIGYQGNLTGQLVPAYATGTLNELDRRLSTANRSIDRAMKRERAMSGNNPFLAVLNDKEIVLNAQQSDRFTRLGLAPLVMAGGNMPMPSSSVSIAGSNVNYSPTYQVSGGGDNRTMDAVKGADAIARQVFQQEFERRMRPNGAIEKKQRGRL